MDPSSPDLGSKSKIGLPLSQLPTPLLMIDRSIFTANCLSMHQTARANSLLFRAHVKTHKTAQGAMIQLDPARFGLGKEVEVEGKVEDELTGKLIVSTVAEGWGILNDVISKDESIVKDILYSLPPSPSTIRQLIPLYKALASKKCRLLVMLDSPAQVDALDSAMEAENVLDPAINEFWCFVKTDSGGMRAGLTPDSPELETLIKSLAASKYVKIHGFYCHAGQSYASTSDIQASEYLGGEVDTVNRASIRARQILSEIPTQAGTFYDERTFVLSVGATPTAHAAGTIPWAKDSHGVKKGWLEGGRLELHAGNYCIHDLQQIHTSLVATPDVACQVIATVCSVYPTRGQSGEAICDAGGIAMSKDTGPMPGFGQVQGDELKGWSLGRMSQEHGILTYPEAQGRPDRLPQYGEMIRIIPQHACYTLAAHGEYIVVDSLVEEQGSDWKTWKVREIWTPWKFW